MNILSREFGISGQNEVPILFFDAPSGCRRRELYHSFAENLGIPYNFRNRWDELPGIVKKGLRVAKTRVVLIDEVNNLFAGPKGRQREILDDLKTMSNNFGIIFLLSGTKAALDVINQDPQYVSRFPPIGIEVLSLDVRFIGILKSFEEVMKVAEGTFAGKEPSKVIFAYAQRAIGRVVYLLNESLRIAEEKGSESIHLSHIQMAGHSDLPWLTPNGGEE